MFPEKLNLSVPGLEDAKLPRMVRIRQHLDDTVVADVRDTIFKSIDALNADDKVKGKSIAITAGSRGIAQFSEIMKAIVDKLKEMGAKPFIFPAMGSHGGGTVEGQVQVLKDYGVTEESMGAPIRASMEVVKVAELEDGMPVYCDKLAWESDGIVVFNRVKPHTMFKGEHESGLLKMCVIGLSKHKGAATYHRRSFREFPWLIPAAAGAFISAGKVVFAVASVENGHEKVRHIEAIAPDKIFERDKELLKMSKNSMARIMLDKFEVLVVDEIGKNISGDGMDPNVIGRNGMGDRFDGTPEINTIVALNLTPQTHGNATGIGAADITTLRAAREIDLNVTYINHITSGAVRYACLPMMANNDNEALRIASMSCGLRNGGLRYVHVRNTLELEYIEVSENMLPEIVASPDKFTILSDAADMEFNNGYLKRVQF